MVWLIGFGLSCLWDIVGKQNLSEWTKEYRNPAFLNVEILLMVAPKYVMHTDALKCLTQTGTDILLYPAKSK